MRPRRRPGGASPGAPSDGARRASKRPTSPVSAAQLPKRHHATAQARRRGILRRSNPAKGRRQRRPRPRAFFSRVGSKGSSKHEPWISWIGAPEHLGRSIAASTASVSSELVAAGCTEELPAIAKDGDPLTRTLPRAAAGSSHRGPPAACAAQPQSTPLIACGTCGHRSGHLSIIAVPPQCFLTEFLRLWCAAAAAAPTASWEKRRSLDRGCASLAALKAAARSTSAACARQQRNPSWMRHLRSSFANLAKATCSTTALRMILRVSFLAPGPKRMNRGRSKSAAAPPRCSLAARSSKLASEGDRISADASARLNAPCCCCRFTKARCTSAACCACRRSK
mmetsp:Transcript_9231/g.31789  ORF Transcript_9231/g.31789 Transcript_9231/m.31789 type:complete len:339 (+) Transcript_9231:166-1182(+)